MILVNIRTGKPRPKPLAGAKAAQSGSGAQGPCESEAGMKKRR